MSKLELKIQEIYLIKTSYSKLELHGIKNFCEGAVKKLAVNYKQFFES